MRVIAVMTPKGGIGKTITASSTSYLLGEEHKKKVLLADGDQQGNLSKLFGYNEPDGIGMSELLERHKTMGGEYSTSDLIKTTPYSHIDIIPANGYLMLTNMKLLSEKEENQINRFSRAIEEISGVYDYLICDCGLTLDMTVINILVAADLVIAPVKLGGFEADALDNIIGQIEELRQFNPSMELKMLMTMRQGNKTTTQAEEYFQNNYNAYKHSVRRSVVVERSTIAFTPLPAFSKNGIVTKDYREVVAELLQDMEG